MRLILLFSLLVSLGCGDDSMPPMGDAGFLDTSVGDDAGGGTDAGTDAGMTMADAGTDSGPVEMCDDPVPDDDYTEAKELGDISDGDDFPSGTEMGDISPISDQDWYVWHVDDGAFADVDPRATLSARPAGVVWELCVYFDCDSEIDSDGIGCDSGTPHVLVDGEIEGCCLVTTEGAAQVTLAPKCTGIDDSGRVYARVSRQGGRATCDGYELSWGDS